MLSESNQKAFDEAIKSLRLALQSMQLSKEHGKVEVVLNMVSGGVSGIACTKVATEKVK